MHASTILFLLLFSLNIFADNSERLESLKTIKRIAFGSCNNQNDSQPLWKDMLRQKPDLFIWGGDNVYADRIKDINRVRDAYKKQNDQVDYINFKSQTPYIGTWDDHDFAFNNAGGNLGFKKVSQELMLDFFEVKQDSPRRQQEGIYTSYEFGEDNQKIKIILLDNRYFKGLDPEAPILGKKQWDWLRNELKNSTASLHFIVSGLSVFSPLIKFTDQWRNSPIEVERMLEVIKTYKVKAPVFLSGDKHFSSIFTHSGQLEFMSSGMTHTAPKPTWWYLGRNYPNTYFGLSYGQIDISWDKSTPKLKLMIRNESDEAYHRNVIWENGTWAFFPTQIASEAKTSI